MNLRASAIRLLALAAWMVCSSTLLMSHVQALAAAPSLSSDRIGVQRVCAAPEDTSAGDQFAGFAPEISVVGILPQGALGLPGEQIDWLITLTNEGTARGTDIVVTDVLRDELRVDQVVADDGFSSIDGQRVDLMLPVLSPGDSVAMQITTTVLRGTATGSLINRVSMVGLGPDGEVSQSAVAEVFVPTRLPATGYPPEEDLPGEGEPSAFVIALIAFSVVALTAYIVWRRGQWSYHQMLPGP